MVVCVDYIEPEDTNLEKEIDKSVKGNKEEKLRNNDRISKSDRKSVV